MVFNNDENNHTVLNRRQSNVNTDKDTHKNILFLPTGSTAVVVNPGCMEQW